VGESKKPSKSISNSIHAVQTRHDGRHQSRRHVPGNVYPIYVVIDRDGNIAGTQRGAGGEEALRRLMARAGLESDSGAN